MTVRNIIKGIRDWIDGKFGDLQYAPDKKAINVTDLVDKAFDKRGLGTKAGPPEVGTCAFKDHTASVKNGSSDLPTSGAVYTAIQAALQSGDNIDLSDLETKINKSFQPRKDYSGNINDLYGPDKMGMYNLNNNASGTLPMGISFGARLIVFCDGSEPYQQTLQILIPGSPAPGAGLGTGMHIRWSSYTTWSAWVDRSLGSAAKLGVINALSDTSASLITGKGVYNALQNIGGATVEKGTWTPTVNITAISTSITPRTGRYICIGDIVIVSCYIAFNIPQSGETNALSRISGLPYISADSNNNTWAGFAIAGPDGGFKYTGGIQEKVDHIDFSISGQIASASANNGHVIAIYTRQW